MPEAPPPERGPAADPLAPTDAPPPPPSAPLTGALSPLALGLGVAFVLTATLGFEPGGHIYTADGVEQLAAAQCVLRGDAPCPGMAYWPPLLPLLVSLIAPLAGGIPGVEVAGRLLSLAATGWVAGIIAATGASLLRRARLPAAGALGLIAAVAATAVPALFFFASLVDNRPLYLLTLAATLALGCAYLARPARPWPLALAAGPLALCASLARPEGLAVLPILLAAFAADALLTPQAGAPGGRLRAAARSVGAGALGGGALYLAYALLLQEGRGGIALSSRGWELPILHWQAYLDRSLILSLFGFTVEPTPLREAMIAAVAAGDLPPPALSDRIAAFAAIYLDHLPLVLQGVGRAIPTGLLLLAPLGVFALLRARLLGVALLLVGVLTPLVLLPGLPQSADPNLPSGNFLGALPSLGILSALGLGQLLGWLRSTLVPRVGPLAHQGLSWGAGALSLALAASLLMDTRAEARAFEGRFHLFEGDPLPRGAGVWLRGVATADTRLIAAYPATIIAHVAGIPRTPMPSYWEMAQALEDLGDRPNIFVLTSPDLYDDPLMVSALLAHIPDPCAPLFHLTGSRGEWVFACRTSPEAAGPE